MRNIPATNSANIIATNLISNDSAMCLTALFFENIVVATNINNTIVVIKTSNVNMFH